MIEGCKWCDDNDPYATSSDCNCSSNCGVTYCNSSGWLQKK